MKRECAWCKRILDGPASDAADSREITHGICDECATNIEIAVEETARTGRSVVRQPATLQQDDREVRLLITTEKVGRMILLRIDEMSDAELSRPGV